MRLKLTYNRPSGLATDVVVTADSTATIGEVATTILERDPLATQQGSVSPTATMKVAFPGEREGVALDAETPLSSARIASGARLQLVDGAVTRGLEVKLTP